MIVVRKYTITRGNWRSDQRWGVEGGQGIHSGIEGAVTAYDVRDVDPLVEAVRETLCDDQPCSRCDHLRAALALFDNEES